MPELPVDLRSDTVTRPSEGMRRAIAGAAGRIAAAAGIDGLRVVSGAPWNCGDGPTGAAGCTEAGMPPGVDCIGRLPGTTKAGCAGNALTPPGELCGAASEGAAPTTPIGVGWIAGLDCGARSGVGASAILCSCAKPAGAAAERTGGWLSNGRAAAKAFGLTRCATPLIAWCEEKALIGIAFAAQPTSLRADWGGGALRTGSPWVPGTNALMSTHEAPMADLAPPR